MKDKTKEEIKDKKSNSAVRMQAGIIARMCFEYAGSEVLYAVDDDNPCLAGMVCFSVMQGGHCNFSALRVHGI